MVLKAEEEEKEETFASWEDESVEGGVLCHATSRHATSRHVTSCHVMPMICAAPGSVVVAGRGAAQ